MKERQAQEEARRQEEHKRALAEAQTKMEQLEIEKRANYRPPQ